MPNETPKAGHDDDLADDIIEVQEDDLEDEADDATDDDVEAEAELDEDDDSDDVDDEDDEGDDEDDTVSAAGATKRKKAAKKPLTKAELREEVKKHKRAERERIERSKQIAAEARGKKYEPKGSAKAKTKDADGKPLTKEQQRAAAAAESRAAEGNPVWFKPIMFGFLILGFLWILVYYLSSGRAPVSALGDWNILIGFGIALVGFLMMSNWK